MGRFRTVTQVWNRQISRSHGSKNRRFGPKLGVSGLYLQLEFTNGYEMMHRARSSIVEVPYCFSRSSVKFQGHTALKIVEFDPKWACWTVSNSSLNSPMAMKCCTKLETAKERCPIVFQGHPSNFKVTRYKASPILTQIGRFRTVGQSQLSNPSDLPCLSHCHFISAWIHIYMINILMPRQNDRQFADDVFKCIFLNENVLVPISLKFVLRGPIDNTPVSD